MEGYPGFPRVTKEDRAQIARIERIRDAAPELLEALKAIAHSPCGEPSDDIWKQMHAAIAKAEGRVADSEEVVPTPEPHQQDKMVDIMDALRASLAVAKGTKSSEQRTPRPNALPPSTHPEKLAGSEDLVEYWTPKPRPVITATFEATPSMRLRSQSIGRGNRCIWQEDGQPLMWVGTEAPEDQPPTQPIRFRGSMRDL